MGTSSWNPSEWDSHRSTVAAKPAAAIFTKSAIVDALNPLNIKLRESRDSVANPNSTPVIIGGDITGSMGDIATVLVKEGVGIVMGELLSRKPISDPQMMFIAIGDADAGDRAPCQATQFEVDMKIAEQLAEVFVEGHGGNNGYENYELPYYFAATRTSHDSFEIRGKKGYIFTYGDEPPSPGLNADSAKRVLGDSLQANIPFAQVLEMAMKTYHCYHIIIAQGSHVSHHGLDSVQKPWTKLLGQHAVVLDDYTKLAELIVSIIQVNEGASVDDVASSWAGGTAVAIRKAVTGLTKTGSDVSTGVATL